MNITDLTPETIQGAISDFYRVVDQHVANLVFSVAAERYSIPRFPRRLGSAEFKYFFAADLDLLFRYALGGVDASQSHVRSLCKKVETILFASAATPQPQETPPEFVDTVLGTAIRAARARTILRQDDAWLSRDEISLLSGFSPQKIAGARMKSKRNKGKVIYPTAEVRELFKRESIRI